MLARLSLRSARFPDMNFHSSDLSLSEDDDRALVVDVDVLRRFVRPWPDLAWQNIAAMCGRTITPVYKGLQTLLSDDVEHIAHLLSELEPFCHDDMIDDENSRRATLPPLLCSTTTTSRQCNNDIRKDISSHTYPRRRRRQASAPIDHPLIILSTHCSIPMIIITPCLPQPHDSMSRPPFQDSSFGDRLTLPRSYPVFNDVFPPLLPTPHPPLPAVEKWRWVDGHWRAVLPTLEEQRRQGLFSRYVMAKRKRAGTSPRAC